MITAVFSTAFSDQAVTWPPQEQLSQTARFDNAGLCEDKTREAWLAGGEGERTNGWCVQSWTMDWHTPTSALATKTGTGDSRQQEQIKAQMAEMVTVAQRVRTQDIGGVYLEVFCRDCPSSAQSQAMGRG